MKAKKYNAKKDLSRKTGNRHQPPPNDPILEKMIRLSGTSHNNGLNMVREVGVNAAQRDVYRPPPHPCMPSTSATLTAAEQFSQSSTPYRPPVSSGGKAAYRRPESQPCSSERTHHPTRVQEASNTPNQLALQLSGARKLLNFSGLSKSSSSYLQNRDSVKKGNRYL